MAQKIVSPRAELTVLRAICHKDRKIAGAVLSSVDESYFDSEESIELLKVMKHHVAESGEIPSYKLILEDPDISQEARSFFRDSDATVQTAEEARKAVKTLNRYRQLRTLYKMAAYVDEQMQRGKVDLEAVLDQVSNQVSLARTSKTTKDSFLHFGKNNNSQDFIKDLLYNDSKEDTIPTGIKPFDQESGGFMRGSLVTLGASSGGGKCASLDTSIQLSTLVVELEGNLRLELEPEDLVVLTSGSLRRAEDLRTGDDIETDPDLVRLHFVGYFQSS